MNADIALVMLPGAYFGPADFAANGFIDALAQRGLRVDAIAADLPPAAYLDGDVCEILHDTVIRPVLASDRRVWLLGISLGALGAILYAQSRPDCVSGLIVLAPFLGSRGLVAEVLDAGGLDTWQPGPDAPLAYERRMMAGLKRAFPPRLHLGYGTEDRFAPASRLLASRLDPRHVIAVPGDHDWTTWQRLWSLLLERDPFGMTPQ